MNEMARELTFDPSGKSDNALWADVQEACRVSTPAWRAYEELRARHTEAAMRIAALETVLRQCEVTLRMPWLNTYGASTKAQELILARLLSTSGDREWTD